MPSADGTISRNCWRRWRRRRARQRRSDLQSRLPGPSVARYNAPKEDATMPLRDHFRSPVCNQASWEGFHGGWPMMMVLDLAPKLPKGFAAEPRVHLGTYFEIDVCTFDKDGARDWHSDPDPVTNGGVATATLAPPAPTLTVDV